MDKEYRVRVVQTRKPFKGAYGEFATYGLQLDGFANGWVELVQKPETKPPVVGDVMFGHIESRRVPSKTGGDDMVFYKFKKGNAQEQQAVSSNNADMAYVVQMLEELTGRRKQPESPTGRDVVLEDIEEGTPFELETPFDDLL